MKWTEQIYLKNDTAEGQKKMGKLYLPYSFFKKKIKEKIKKKS